MDGLGQTMIGFHENAKLHVLDNAAGQVNLAVHATSEISEINALSSFPSLKLISVEFRTLFPLSNGLIFITPSGFPLAKTQSRLKSGKLEFTFTNDAQESDKYPRPTTVVNSRGENARCSGYDNVTGSHKNVG